MLWKKLSSKRGDANFVSVIILMSIAVVAAVLFKDYIRDILIEIIF